MRNVGVPADRIQPECPGRWRVRRGRVRDERPDRVVRRNSAAGGATGAAPRAVDRTGQRRVPAGRVRSRGPSLPERPRLHGALGRADADTKGRKAMTVWLRAKRRRLGLALLLVSWLPTVGWAQDDTELAKKTQNPVADLISVPFQNNINFGVGP